MFPWVLPGMFFKRNPQPSRLFLGSCAVNTVVFWAACLSATITFARLSISKHKTSNYVGNFSFCLWTDLQFFLINWSVLIITLRQLLRIAAVGKRRDEWVWRASRNREKEFQDFCLFLWYFCSPKPTRVFKDKCTERNGVGAAVFCILAFNEKLLTAWI